MLVRTANLVITYHGGSGESIFVPQQIKQEKNTDELWKIGIIVDTCFSQSILSYADKIIS